MSFNFEDFSEGGSPNKNKIACPLGDKCTHVTEEECDKYRQSLLEKEHQQNCDEFKIHGQCRHFGKPEKGVPEHARFQGLSPAEYLVWSRGKQNA